MSLPGALPCLAHSVFYYGVDVGTFLRVVHNFACLFICPSNKTFSTHRAHPEFPRKWYWPGISNPCPNSCCSSGDKNKHLDRANKNTFGSVKSRSLHRNRNLLFCLRFSKRILGCSWRVPLSCVRCIACCRSVFLIRLFRTHRFFCFQDEGTLSVEDSNGKCYIV